MILQNNLIIMNMDKEQAKQEMKEAIQFCLEKKLFREQELNQARETNNYSQLALKAVHRMELYKKIHKQ